MLAGALVRRIRRWCRRFFAPWAGRPQGANSRKRVPPAPKIFEGGSPLLADAFTATAATTTIFGLAGLGLEDLGIEGLGTEGLGIEGLGTEGLGLEGLALESFDLLLPASL